MKNTIIQEIEQSLLNYLDNSQLDVLHTILCRCLDKVEIKVVEDTDIHISEFTNMELINKFLLIYNRVVDKMKVVYQFYESVIIKKPKKVNV